MLKEFVNRLKDFEARLKDMCVFPMLLVGEKYVGVVLNHQGEPDYHLIVKDWGVEKPYPEFVNLPSPKEVTLAYAQLENLNHLRYWLRSTSGERVTTNGRFLRPGGDNELAGVLEVRRVPV